MLLQFHIHYHTVFGEQIIIRFRQQGADQIHYCQTYDGENWTGSLDIKDNQPLSYQYGIDRHGRIEYEGGTDRILRTRPFLCRIIGGYPKIRSISSMLPLSPISSFSAQNKSTGRSQALLLGTTC